MLGEQVATRSESIFIGLLKEGYVRSQRLSTGGGWGIRVYECQLLAACESQLVGSSSLIILLFTVFEISHLTCHQACMLGIQVLIQQLLHQKRWLVFVSSLSPHPALTLHACLFSLSAFISVGSMLLGFSSSKTLCLGVIEVTDGLLSESLTLLGT